MINTRLIAPPLQEPISLALAKLHLRINASWTAEDTLISAFITAARQYAEKYMNRSFFPQTWELALDHFPWANWFSGTTILAEVRENWPFWSAYLDVLAIKLPYPRALAVNSVVYLDSTSTPQTLSASTYALDVDSMPARLYPLYNMSWPTQQAVLPGSVKVNFTAGSFCTPQVDSLLVPTSGPFTVSLSQGANYLGMASLLDQSAEPVSFAATAVLTNGVITGYTLTVPSGYAAQYITATYYVPQIPQTMIAAMLLTIGHLYKNREATVETAMQNLPYGVEMLLNTEKHFTFSV
jgi:hypothetical protein